MAGNKMTVSVSTGDTIVAGSLMTTGSLTVDGDKFIVVAADGNVYSDGTLHVGALSTTGNFYVNHNKFQARWMYKAI